jgi:arginine/ornithine succinyltransferase subunit-like protein
MTTRQQSLEVYGGRARLRASIGTETPRWWYHLGLAVHAAPELNLMHRQRTLILGNDLTGAAELDAIELTGDPVTACAALVQQAKTLLHAEPGIWGCSLVVELPGARDADGVSPFWQSLGRHFHGGNTQAEAARLGGEAWRNYIAALLPRQRLYASFLSDDAQAAIGCARADLQPLRSALEMAGLRFAHQVRIDDGGPVLRLDM